MCWPRHPTDTWAKLRLRSGLGPEPRIWIKQSLTPAWHSCLLEQRAAFIHARREEEDKAGCGVRKWEEGKEDVREECWKESRLRGNE